MKNLKEKIKKNKKKKKSFFDPKIKELLKVLDSYENDSLTLGDVIYLDEILENIFYDIKRIKDDLIDDRFFRNLEDAERF